METGIRFDRLETLAQHLETGVLGHEEFDFSDYNTGPLNEVGCGTAGCAIGECPIIWPGEWAFCYNLPLMKGLEPRISNVVLSTTTWFGITEEMDNHLFYAGCQYIEVFGGKMLVGAATRYDVASNIRAFIEKMKTPA